MCGICISVRGPWIPPPLVEGPTLTQMFERLRFHNAARGPDRQNILQIILPSSPDTSLASCQDSIKLDFFASELQLRGNTTVDQPHVKDGNVLCWNGEIFDGFEVSRHENDGVKLLQELCNSNSADEIVALLGRIEGPYAFAFYHAETRLLYFGRDPLGRRSLLMHLPTARQPYFVLSSVSSGISDVSSFEEVSTKAIFCVQTSNIGSDFELTSTFGNSIQEFSRIPISFDLPYAVPTQVNRTIPGNDDLKITSLDTIPDYLRLSVDLLIAELDKSVRLQVCNIPQQNPDEARLAILFSGGIDSAALCYFADRHLPKDEPIDLLNVAFENPRKTKLRLKGNPGVSSEHSGIKRTGYSQLGIMTGDDALYMVPDRISGLEELEELRKVCPGRIWNFVEVDVPYEETQRAKPLVESIMYPSRTVMDLSLALAIWFASRGIGTTRSTPGENPRPHTSVARVLLNGVGSDELLGGYGRHRTAFESGGWAAVVEELQLEIDRIPTRNLGRDDRVISSHGKEARHPFLSLDVVGFLASLPVHHKADFRVGAGFGDKVLLRLAMNKVGLVLASARKKRAMQFGSRSAKMEGEQRGDILLL